MNKAYIATEIIVGYDQMIFGSFVPWIYSTYDLALDAIKNYYTETYDLEDDESPYIFDDVKKGVHFYNEDTGEWEFENKNLSDDYLMRNGEQSLILFEAEMDSAFLNN